MDEREADERGVRGVPCSSSGSIGESAVEGVSSKRLSRHFYRDFCDRPSKSIRAEVEEIEISVE